MRSKSFSILIHVNNESPVSPVVFIACVLNGFRLKMSSRQKQWTWRKLEFTIMQLVRCSWELQASEKALVCQLDAKSNSDWLNSQSYCHSVKAPSCHTTGSEGLR